MTLRGYKSACTFIIELDINSCALTNLHRPVKDKNYAKYRCNRAHVVRIYDKFTELDVPSIKSDYDSNFIYIVGQTVEVPLFNEKINEICTSGIHFYLTKEVAYYHNLDYYIFDKEIYNTYLSKSWSDDGQLIKKCNYKNGKFSGSYESYNENGILRLKCNYNDNNELDGLYEEWFNNGTQKIKNNYKNGKFNGTYESYYANGKMQLKRNYVNNQLDGLYEEWYSDGRLCIRILYKNDKPIRRCDE